MTKKATAKKAAKVGGIVMATRATLELHRSAVAAAKQAGETLGELMLRGIALAIAAKRKSAAPEKKPAAPKATRTSKHKVAPVAPAVEPEKG